jgi:ABC-type phosphate/phosphonate transport system ATPase subunit
MTKSSLLDSIRAENRRPVGPSCWVNQLFQSLSKEDQADLVAALADPDIQHSAIARALRNRGFEVKASAIPRHRRKECSCEPR